MSVDLADLFMLQLAQQAALYDLTHMKDRARSSRRVATFFLKMLELLPVNVSMEIGAHEATYSRKVKTAKPEITVRAFEANPHVYAHFMLDGTLRELGVDYRHTAIGDKNGAARFHIYESVLGQAEPVDSRRQSCLLRTDSPGAGHYAITTPMATLDMICAADGDSARYALWVDAEGFSKQVLAGANSILERTLAIYIELESVGKFEGQALDREIMASLLDRDFIPILRDFQFNHQYNVIFVKKDSLSLLEHEWHRYFQAVLRGEFSDIFNLTAKNSGHIPVRPQELGKITLRDTRDFRDAVESLPLLRIPADGLNPAKTVVACHASDLEEARGFYKARGRKQPQFYVLEDTKETLHDDNVRDFSELAPGMDIQVFFKANSRPDHTWFGLLANGLAEKGIETFHVEKYCLSSFWRRDYGARTTERDIETMCAFFNILKDSWSQYTYLAICRANMSGEAGYIPISSWPQYSHPLVHAAPGDIICEGGLEFYRKNDQVESTTLDFCNAIDGKGIIYGFEPVRETYDELQSLCREKPEIVLEAKALWSHSGFIALAGCEKPNCAHTVEIAGSGVDCPCVSIDEFFADKDAPTLIKLDVEGAEPEILQGAAHTVSQYSPKLMVAIYHGRRGPDWVNVPNILMANATGYDFYCGHHTPWFAESFVYGRKHHG